MAKILIIEDDKGISDFIVAELEHEGYETVLATTGREGLEKANSENPDLILLDVMLPEMNGLEVLRRVRQKSRVPVILETARGETIDKINGLNEGADDYIAKPFEIEELLARINALLRRVQFSNTNSPIIKHGELEINTSSMMISVNGNSLCLSKIEFLMLKLFIEKAGTVLSRNNIIDSVWGENHYIDINTVDVYVGYLRTKLSEYSEKELIKTVRGSGYIME